MYRLVNTGNNGKLMTSPSCRYMYDPHSKVGYFHTEKSSSPSDYLLEYTGKARGTLKSNSLKWNQKVGYGWLYMEGKGETICLLCLFYPSPPKKKPSSFISPKNSFWVVQQDLWHNGCRHSVYAVRSEIWRLQIQSWVLVKITRYTKPSLNTCTQSGLRELEQSTLHGFNKGSVWSFVKVLEFDFIAPEFDKKPELTTAVEGNPKTPFSITTTQE